jgi:hypothetical protein
MLIDYFTRTNQNDKLSDLAMMLLYQHVPNLLDFKAIDICLITTSSLYQRLARHTLRGNLIDISMIAISVAHLQRQGLARSIRDDGTPHSP